MRSFAVPTLIVAACIGPAFARPVATASRLLARQLAVPEPEPGTYMPELMSMPESRVEWVPPEYPVNEGPWRPTDMAFEEPDWEPAEPFSEHHLVARSKIGKKIGGFFKKLVHLVLREEPAEPVVSPFPPSSSPSFEGAPHVALEPGLAPESMAYSPSRYGWEQPEMMDVPAQEVQWKMEPTRMPIEEPMIPIMRPVRRDHQLLAREFVDALFAREEDLD
ncbi:uncharacterized protein FIBRA_07550 [Fibroporia radiculosa]|uniref:Uncharacterized protein n=1 Tax=Fibroporia radiculosa TaxID=599839 RepID=J4IBV8_9APHY|nr:uncharacterized protein FIBRA_07550 [Fibroporia radiculosa]CCM05336.1 predicted protein [Fibroporia radiculosa]